jgi:hypothetical protein
MSQSRHIEHLALAMLILVTGCDTEKGGSAAAPSASATATATPSVDLSPTGVKACDDYIAAAAACIDKATGTQKDNLRISIQQQRNQVAQAKTDEAKEMVAIGCEAELDALKEDATCK